MLSIYVSERTAQEQGVVFRRHALRIDGFASCHASLAGGEVMTHPLVFRGSRLNINFSTSAAGGIRVEIQDAGGQPLPGFALADCPEVFGDAIERTVGWQGGNDVSALAGKSVRIRFVLRDADLFAFQFTD